MKLFLAAAVAAVLTLITGAPGAMAQAYTATNIWTSAGGDPYWPTAGNWTNSIVPTPTSLVLLTNFGISGLPGTNGSGAVGTPSIIVSNDTSVASLHVMNTNMFGASALFHTIQISNGVTLTVSNNPISPQINVIQICSQSGAGAPSAIGSDYGSGAVIYSTIQGEGGTLAVIATNGLGTTFARGNIFAGQGTLGLSAEPTIDPLNAILDLSGLDNFRVDANHIILGDGGIGGFFFNRPAGTIYFAKTNLITLWAVGGHASASQANGGLITGLIAQNNGGGLTRSGRFFLGITNAFFCNSGLNLAVRGCSGWLGFNPSNAPGISTAFFRDRTTGVGRQTTWSVGNRLNAGALGNIKGELDFSRGTVDAMVGTLGIAVSGLGNTTIGVVSFGSGTIDVNTLQLGVQSASATGPVQGTLSVSNAATLKVNTSGALGGAVGTPGGSFFARLNITDGGTVTFANTAPLNCGVGSSSEIKLLNGSKLAVLNIGSPAAPLTSLQIADSILTVDRGLLSNPAIAPISIANLDASGNNTINMLGAVLVAGRFPLIQYSTLVNGGFTNFTLGATSPGVTAYLTNNAANNSIDVVITSSLTSVLTWNGQTNGVDVGIWDIATTTNWLGGVGYTQAAVPGSLVRFDDTAAGTTTVTFTNVNLAPADILVTNAVKNYTFTGTGGLVGPTALTKDGDGTLVIANSGSNGFTGGVLINKGTLQISGSANRLPTNSIVSIADAASTKLDLNGLDQVLGSISGGGTTGGEITLGAGNLTIRSGPGNFAGVISGGGALLKNSSGTQTLSGANTYAGGTVVSNSTLLVVNSSGSGLGSGPVNIGAGGTLQIGNGSADGSVSAAYITNNGVLNLNPASSMTLVNVVVGTGNMLKLLGSGSTISITNANPYTGASAVQQGVIHISHSNALGAGSITVGNATGTDTYLALAGNITVTNAITLSGKTGAIVPSPVGINNQDDFNTGATAGTNTLSGPLTVTGSTCWSVGADAGKLIINGTFATTQSGALCEFFLRGSAEGILASGLKDSSPSLRIMLTKTDAGTWTLAGTNTFTGRTAINAGALIVDGALNGSSNATVSAFATLGGKGLITGAVTNFGTLTVGADGVLATLTISNILYNFGPGVTTNSFDVSASGNDQIRGLTTAYYGGNLRVNLLGTLSGNCVFKLFDSANYVGAFDTFELPDITPLSWDTSKLAVDGTLRAVGGPNVAPAITGINPGGAGSYNLAGTGTLVAPYTILASTNVALPLANWQNVGSGTFTNGVFFFKDIAATNFSQRFYLLTTPAP